MLWTPIRQKKADKRHFNNSFLQKKKTASYMLRKTKSDLTGHTPKTLGCESNRATSSS